MGKGLDSNTPLTDHAACIRKAGFDFVCRYYKETASALARPEAEALSAAGLYIVSVVERGFPTSAGYFSHAKGLADGAWAYARAKAVGQPPGSPIYFAVDYDANGGDVDGPIEDYFRGVSQAFNAKNSHPDYPIGVYGSGFVCRHLLQHTGTSYAWLAMSVGWFGSHSFTGWNLKQTTRGSACGVSVDFDESSGHGGGWKIG